jgi:AmmeMemoRadiSam system protein A
MLSSSEKQFLLRAARLALEQAVKGAATDPLPPCSDGVREKRGAFVTLRIREELRGCIGYVDPVGALSDVVQELAVKAALEDVRFLPVAERELPQISIEISVLSALTPFIDIEDIEIGTHGLVLELGRSRSLLLPQVAVEFGWDRETFLDHTARKAGLPSDAWNHPEVRKYLFTAEIFAEQTSDVNHP